MPRASKSSAAVKDDCCCCLPRYCGFTMTPAGLFRGFHCSVYGEREMMATTALLATPASPRLRRHARRRARRFLLGDGYFWRGSAPCRCRRSSINTARTAAASTFITPSRPAPPSRAIAILPACHAAGDEAFAADDFTISARCRHGQRIHYYLAYARPSSRTMPPPPLSRRFCAWPPMAVDGMSPTK